MYWFVVGLIHRQDGALDPNNKFFSCGARMSGVLGSPQRCRVLGSNNFGTRNAPGLCSRSFCCLSIQVDQVSVRFWASVASTALTWTSTQVGYVCKDQKKNLRRAYFECQIGKGKLYAVNMCHLLGEIQADLLPTLTPCLGSKLRIWGTATQKEDCCFYWAALPYKGVSRMISQAARLLWPYNRWPPPTWN